MISDHIFVDVESIEPIYHHDGREQIRRMVTAQRYGMERFSFHVVHFDGNLDKEMCEQADREIVLFGLAGSATIEWEGGRETLRPGVAFVVARGVRYRHTTGPQGLTIAVCASPPVE